MTIQSWREAGRLAVCFGHQSVGEQVVEALLAKVGFPLTVRATRNPADVGPGVFGHFRVGRNGDPLSKCADFVRVIEGGVGDRVDVALFKLCYVDITASTDIDLVCGVYQETMAKLSRAYPLVRFLHTTVPLRRLPPPRMGWLRSRTGWVGREWKDQANRHAYNERIRSAYVGTGRLFDLAAIEATYPDGRTSLVACGGLELPSLVPQYTDDGGHLTESAAAGVAAHLVELMRLGAAERHGAPV